MVVSSGRVVVDDTVVEVEVELVVVVVEVVVVVVEVEVEVVVLVLVVEDTELLVNASSGTITKPAPLILQANR